MTWRAEKVRLKKRKTGRKWKTEQWKRAGGKKVRLFCRNTLRPLCLSLSHHLHERRGSSTMLEKTTKTCHVIKYPRAFCSLMQSIKFTLTNVPLKSVLHLFLHSLYYRRHHYIANKVRPPSLLAKQMCVPCIIKVFHNSNSNRAVSQPFL